MPGEVKAVSHDDRGGCGFVYFSDAMRVGWAAWENDRERDGRPYLFGSSWGIPADRHFLLAHQHLRKAGVRLPFITGPTAFSAESQIYQETS